MQLILYSKPGCHLCEGLKEKLGQVKTLNVNVEIRDITTREDWFKAYQYEVPVLYQKWGKTEKIIPRPSPRLSVARLEQLLQKYTLESDA
ncbi:MAG: glutaredoxin family protein [cyanobacterium endosymbiont of Rhopalodia musculus]|uniref:glutaredoxin family protein n=1 Tax=cyanobacterium endosymbiont of Epithemia clementina EcSB TaxID=3034674 RepID=UPI002480A3E1|nr:glutaredoxin family protein [cyanobacterium endosymbiont of Epithemia clementina EcSB]WGT66657.1 glutaredoxin family protein [cyanobacterium endosymbiont of Epithemia clementina EcSB]